jgi:methionine synthase II (cobalamin-independent)
MAGKSAGPPFRAEHVGSLLRPAELKSAFREFHAGAIDRERFQEVQDRYIRDAVAMQEELGLRSITDGEFRRGSDLEDAMFRNPDIADFRAEVYSSSEGHDMLRLLVETRDDTAAKQVLDDIKKTFQVTPEIARLERGTIARDFEADVKAQRFVDKRG